MNNKDITVPTIETEDGKDHRLMGHCPVRESASCACYSDADEEGGAGADSGTARGEVRTPSRQDPVRAVAGRRELLPVPAIVIRASRLDLSCAPWSFQQ